MIYRLPWRAGLLGQRRSSAYRQICPRLAGLSSREADYLGVGPAFTTSTKTNARAVLGVAGIAAVRAATRLPLVAIGGITAGSVAAVRAAGADGICVIGAVFGADDPETAARALMAEWERVGATR